MKRTAAVLLLMITLLMAGAGCRRHQDASPDEARVRLINAVPNAEGLTVAVDGRRVWNGPRFGSNTGYQAIPEGRYDVRIGSGDGTLAQGAMTFARGQDYTVLALGPPNAASAARALVFPDDRAAFVPPGRASIRLIHAAPGIGRVDALFNRIVGIRQLAFAMRSDALTLDSGDYELALASRADRFDPVAEPVRLTLESGHAYTVVAMKDRNGVRLHAYQDR